VEHVYPLHLVKVNLCLAIVLVQQIFNAVFPKLVVVALANPVVVTPTNLVVVHVEVMHVLLLDQSKAMAIKLIL
jgi:hypothetical protein